MEIQSWQNAKAKESRYGFVNTYLLLGRTGDLCSILPFLKQEAEKPRLIVSNQHSPLLEGVSYVDVVEFDGGVHLLKEAHDWAKSKFGTAKSLQVIGAPEVVRDVTYRPAGVENARATSFVKEMWRCAGKLDKWDEVWPLVFDKRAPLREERLVEKYLPKKPGKPRKVLLVFTESHSSPFQYKALLSEILQLHFGKTHTIIVNPQAERFFDLLALYERASAIVCVDSAPLHLARATPNVPVIALTNDSPTLWNGAPWMPNHHWYCRYKDFPNRAVEMVHAIELAEVGSSSFLTISVADTGFSMGSSMVIREGMTGRDSHTALGDEKRYPYFKDCLRMGLQRASDDQVVAVVMDGTSIDTAKVPGAPCYSYRMEMKNGNLSFAPVVDFFSARKSWWKERLPEIPDYIFGRGHYWRNGLWALFKKHHGVDATGICTRTAPKA